jgi:hypothetical protein
LQLLRNPDVTAWSAKASAERAGIMKVVLVAKPCRIELPTLDRDEDARVSGRPRPRSWARFQAPYQPFLPFPPSNLSRPTYPLSSLPLLPSTQRISDSQRR